jgi:hypothetical protein
MELHTKNIEMTSWLTPKGSKLYGQKASLRENVKINYIFHNYMVSCYPICHSTVGLYLYG